MEDQLDSFDPAERLSALRTLAERADAGEIPLSEPTTDVNLHCHTFFSYNAYGYSPSRFAWMARQAGLAVAGIVDFDVLDGLDEFLHAAELLNIKAFVGMETRVFIHQFADREINSPGEPGISYHMGVGFPSSDPAGSAGDFLAGLKQTAQRRNRDLMARVNDHLAPATLDYEKDVLSLTPAGNATERHLSLAFARAARRQFPADNELLRFWADKLTCDAETIRPQLPHGPDLLNLIRAKTMKRGGVGYVQPDGGSFPSLEQTNEFILASGGMATHTWLNGLSDGEQAIEELLETAMDSGVTALNIIPDRNFQPGVKDRKLANLYQIVALAEKLDLPLIVGTEMNSPDQKFIDDFDSEELSPLIPAFLKGAHIVYAHSVLQRQCGLGYTSDWARRNFADRRARNTFFEKLGKNLQPAHQNTLAQFDDDAEPKLILQKVTNP